jgi:hypothetical protein
MAWNGRFTAMLLCAACLLLFNWPLLSIPGEGAGFGTLIYLFLGWAAAIAGLRIYCGCAMKLQEKDGEGENYE